MDRDNDNGEGPLSSEQMEREKWREGETILEEGDAPGHTLPESERDGATTDSHSSSAGPGGTILPPD